MTKNTSLFMFVLIFISSISVASDFEGDSACMKGAALELKAVSFGKKKEVMDDEAYSNLCAGNNASTAIECVKETYKHFGSMRPWGLANVCSQGASSESAIGCLETGARIFKDQWSKAVAACDGTTRKFTSCVLPEAKNLSCAAFPGPKSPLGQDSGETSH